MELLLKHTTTRVFCDGIQSSPYEQGLQDCSNPLFPTIINLFFSNFDHHYAIIESRDKDLYGKQRLIEIVTDIDEKKASNYDKFTYLGCMNPTLIQQGLQSMKSVSSLLYLGDYYNVTPVVFIESSMLKVVTSAKERNKFNILYTLGGKWKEVTDVDTVDDKFQEGQFEDLGTCLTLDVSTRDIYIKYLQSVGKYKVQELIDVAKSMNISLEKDGKKKIKKQLYDDINSYQLNLK